MGTWHLMIGRYSVIFTCIFIIFLFSFGEMFFLFFYFCHIMEMILPDILEWKKHAVVQTVFPIFRNLLFLASEPISSDKC